MIADRVYADPGADWWLVEDLVVYLKLGGWFDSGEQDMEAGKRVIYGYRYLARKHEKAGNPRPGDLVKEDMLFGRTPAWRPSTIIRWERERPGPGTGGGRYARRQRGTLGTDSEDSGTAGELVLAGAVAAGQG